MTNAELITALRYCGNFEDREGCDAKCPYFNDKDCPKRIMCDAADALEAAEKRIKELETRLPKEGEWTTKRTWEHDGETYCSVCGHDGTVVWNYCPNCGAKMKTVTDCHASGEENDEQ